LEGRGGNDTLRGNAGNDFYRFDLTQPLAMDTITELAGEGFDTLRGIPPAAVNLASALQQVVSPNLTLTLAGLNVENVLP
jgi:Ca2+-binding RTX toxin-like protein